MAKNKDRNKKREDIITFKIITLGDSGVGKTSIINRYISGKFDNNIFSTIGINFSLKKLVINKSQNIQLKIIDTCGQEKYRSLSKSYFRQTDGVLYVFGLNDKSSFDSIKEWMKYFDEENTIGEIPKVLVGNKCDLKFDEGLDKNLIQEFSKENNIKYIETSAKGDLNINELFEELGKMIYKKELPLDKQDIKIIISSSKKKIKKKCEMCKNDL